MSRFYLWCLTVAPTLVLATDAYARAGGGGSHGKGSWVGIILLPFVYLGFWLVKQRAAKRDRVISQNLTLLSGDDPLWNEDALRARIEQAYFAVQNAWTQRNQDLAKDYMSQRLYDKHKMQTDIMLQNETRNVLENINLRDVKLVSLDDQDGTRNDKIVAYIEGDMIDYIQDLKTGTITSNPNRELSKFAEFWTFKIENGAWVLDDIDQKAEWSDFKRFTNRSHKFA